jgi:dethiobiotin synthetase
MGKGIYVAGYGSGAGKSTACLAMLAHAIASEEQGGFGLAPSEVAYIKPATQCEMITEVTEFCAAKGIECVPIGPVVFVQGFTNEVMAAENYEERRKELLQTAVGAVEALLARKTLVIVDGVGYPSVGSCCGLGNATLAAALRTPVLLIGNPGLGDCVDTYDLMLTYFEAKGATVRAALVNKAADTARHKVADVLPLVVKWFKFRAPAVAFLGAVPPVPHVEGGTVLDTLVFTDRVVNVFNSQTNIHEFMASCL